MKTLIIGGVSLPSLEKIKGKIKKDEPLFNSSFHNHPWIYNLAYGLTKNNNKVHILSITNLVKNTYCFDVENITYHLLPSENRLKNALTFFHSEIIKIKKEIKKINPDIIHAQSRSYSTYAALKTNYPVVITNHGQLKEHYQALGYKSYKYFISRLYEYLINRKMEVCIGVSPNCINDCLRYLPKDKVFLIENAINEVFFIQKSKEIQNTVLFVGSITPLKQVKELVLAISQINNCKLKIISQSENKPYLKEVKDIIFEKNLGGKIEFLGQKNQEELASEISNCTTLCLPSTYESFGMVLAEAMATGKPVIATNIEGPAFIVKHNYNGLLFEPGNIEQLKNSIKKLLDDKVLYNTLAKNAKNDAIKRFSPQSVAERTYKVYESILK